MVVLGLKRATKLKMQQMYAPPTPCKSFTGQTDSQNREFHRYQGLGCEVAISRRLCSEGRRSTTV